MVSVLNEWKGFYMWSLQTNVKLHLGSIVLQIKAKYERMRNNGCQFKKNMEEENNGLKMH